MINLIIGVLGIVACVLGVIWGSRWKGAFTGVVAGLIALVIAGSISFVPTGYVGIRTKFGQISDKSAKSGISWHVPFIEQVHPVNCKQQEVDFKDLKIWSETSERTELYCQNVVVDYQINAEYAAWIWSNVEEWDRNLVKQTSVESGIKAATKVYNDTDVTDRSKIEGTAKECIQKALNDKYKNQIVNVVSVTIGNINFSDAYNEAIEKKAQAKLATETAEYQNKQVTQQVKAEAEQKKIQAQAEADAKKIQAEGDAEATRIRAMAEAEANEQIAKSLTPDLIELEKIKKWNGELPMIQGAAQPILDISEINEKGNENEEESN